MTFIVIKNDGQLIVDTNYWELENAAKGLYYLSWNARAARLLVPDLQMSSIKEMKDAEYVIVSRGTYQGRDALELLFEDHTDSPFSITIVTEQTDRLIPDVEQGSGFDFLIWTQLGEMHRFPGRYRVVQNLPNLSPWKEH